MFLVYIPLRDSNRPLRAKIKKKNYFIIIEKKTIK